MGKRIYWTPPANSADVTYYEITTAPQAGGTFVVLQPLFPVAQVAGNGSWDDVNKRYYFDDTSGTDTSVYRVVGFEGVGNTVADSGIFQPSSVVAAEMTARYMVDHNWGGVNALQYARNGIPIPNGDVWVFTAADYDAGRRQVPLHRVKTATDGTWEAGIMLEPGLDYMVVFFKNGLYGPDKVRITV